MEQQLKQSVDAPFMRVLYLTTEPIGEEGSVSETNPQDLQDPNIHVIYWDAATDELVVETSTVQNGKIADLSNFLENRRPLWLTLSELNTDTRQERILRSVAVCNYLNSRVSRYLWIGVAVLAIFLVVYYYSQWRSAPPLKLPRLQPVIIQRSS